METNCKFCGDLFKGHGNRQYCNYHCYKEAKKGRNRILYAERKRYDPILRNDRILARFHEHGQVVVLLDTLHQKGFDEKYFLKAVKIDDRTVLVTGAFGFGSYSNDQLKIYDFSDGGD